MATSFYGSTVSHWRAYGEYSTSSTNTTYTISVDGGFQSVSWGFSISNVACTVTIGSSSTSVSGQSVSTSSGATTKVELASLSKTITKTTSSQSVALKVKTVNSGSYYPGTSTASVTVTVPALASYTISYDANGGSGAPSSQTKYYGKTLTLSSTNPTRTGYTFLGWSTSSSATSATYKAGGSYTANSAATLYAVWKLAYIAPTIALTAYRCDSDGTANDEGTYAYLSAAYSADTSANSSNVVETVAFACTALSLSETASPAAQSGTATTVLSGFDTDSTYSVTATATDSNGKTATSTAKVGSTSFIIDIADTGNAIGLFQAAPSSGLGVGKVIYMNKTIWRQAYEGSNAFAYMRILDEDGATQNSLAVGVGSSGTHKGVYDSTNQAWMFWQDEDGDLRLRKNSLGLYPLAHGKTNRVVQTGTVTSASISAGSYANTSVTFDIEYSSSPMVQLTIGSTATVALTAQVYSRSTTGFTARVFSNASSSTLTPTIHWLAVGPVS